MNKANTTKGQVTYPRLILTEKGSRIPFNKDNPKHIKLFEKSYDLKVLDSDINVGDYTALG